MNWEVNSTMEDYKICDCSMCRRNAARRASAKAGKDYFQSMVEEHSARRICGCGAGEQGELGMVGDNLEITETFTSLLNLLQYKNAKYGNSSLEPINVFSKVGAETGLLQRLDDKIARVKNNPELQKNDVADIIGYLVLICVQKGWKNFDEFKD